MVSVPASRVARAGLEPRRKWVLALPAAAPVDPPRDGAELLHVHLVVEGGDEAEDLDARRIDRLLADLPERGVVAPMFEGSLEADE